MTPETSLPVLGERIFSLEDQLAFADFSGDRNPLHIDPLHARRSPAGELVVHGIHTLLWALECWANKQGGADGIASLHVEFTRPFLIGEPSICRDRGVDASGKVRLEIVVPAGEAMLVEFALGSDAPVHALPAGAGAPASASPSKLGMDEMVGRSGGWVMPVEKGRAARLFPALVELCGEGLPILLANTSRLVGMECPGLYSLYSELELAQVVHRADEAPSSIKYCVLRFDRRFGLLTVGVEGAGLTGTVRAFLRPPPTRQASMQELATRVASRSAFYAQRALVVGGSRGLGELTAKLLAAGGADVCLTYHLGRSEAEGVVAEILSHGGKAVVVALDVRAPFVPEDALPTGWWPTHLYYFATPPIFVGARSGFSAELFDRFCDYYVRGFAQLVEHLSSAGLTGAFCPSTVALDELPTDMIEYCAAKAAGEVLCRALVRRNPGLRISNPRLPRLATDQTASMLPVRNQDPLPVMLNLLNDFASVQTGQISDRRSAI